jgi:hypothetical protein
MIAWAASSCALITDAASVTLDAPVSLTGVRIGSRQVVGSAEPSQGEENAMLKHKRIAGIFALVAASIPLVAAAHRSTPASIGRGQDESCFTELFYSSVKNTCTTDRLYDIPLVTDRSGTWAAVVAAEGVSTDAVRCRIVALSALGQLYHEGNVRALPAPGAQQIRLDFAPYTAMVPFDGAAYISCLVKPGGVIRKVTAW